MVVDEYQLYMESYYICNLLTFLDKSLLHVGMVKIFVECVERRFVKKALRKRAKEGLFEIPGSRSPNLRLRNEDIICIEAEGNIERMREIPLENYFIVFLSSARDNFRSFPVEQRKDPDGRAYGVLNFYKDNEEEQQFLHTAVIDANKFLLGVTDRAKTTPNTARGNYTFTTGGALAWWLTHRTPDPEVGGSSPARVAVLCPLARHIYPQKVLVIHRKRWLRPNMTEKLFTGTLSIKQKHLL